MLKNINFYSEVKKGKKNTISFYYNYAKSFNDCNLIIKYLEKYRKNSVLKAFRDNLRYYVFKKLNKSNNSCRLIDIKRFIKKALDATFTDVVMQDVLDLNEQCNDLGSSSKYLLLSNPRFDYFLTTNSIEEKESSKAFKDYPNKNTFKYLTA